MLCWIIILGGALLMIGQHSRSEALFYYFRLEDQVPENHLKRLIEKHISFAFVREKLKESYSDTGRPSIDPEGKRGTLRKHDRNPIQYKEG
jgi:transposase